MTESKGLFKATFGLSRSLIKDQLPALAALFGVGILLNLNIASTTASLRPDQDSLRLTLHLALGLWDLFEGVFLILLLSWAPSALTELKGPHYLAEPFHRSYLTSYLAETLRVIAQVLFWGLLFIIPGFVRYGQLIFVPLIVLFSRDYDGDRVDALELSRKLAKGSLRLILAVIFATAFTQTGIELAASSGLVEGLLPLRVALYLMSFLISIWTYSFILMLFKRKMETLNGSDV